MNTAVEAGEETRRKLQRELDSTTQREKQREEEKERVERQRERLREEIEDLALALQRERQNCMALEKRQKKFDQVSAFFFLYPQLNTSQMSVLDLKLFPPSPPASGRGEGCECSAVRGEGQSRSRQSREGDEMSVTYPSP